MARNGTLADTKSYGWVMVFVTFMMTALCFGGLALVAVRRQDNWDCVSVQVMEALAHPG